MTMPLENIETTPIQNTDSVPTNANSSQVAPLLTPSYNGRNISVPGSFSLENLANSVKQLMKNGSFSTPSIAKQDAVRSSHQMLQNFISSANLDDLEHIIRHEPDLIDKPLPNGYLPVSFAIHQGNTEIVDFLIGRGANLELRDAEHCNAFDHAVQTGDDEMIKKIFAVLVEKETARFVAEKERLEATVKQVKETEVDGLKKQLVEQSRIEFLAKQFQITHADALKKLLEEGVSPADLSMFMMEKVQEMIKEMPNSPELDEFNELLNKDAEQYIAAEIARGWIPGLNLSSRDIHNRLLEHAIETNNPKLFIRLVGEGARFDTCDASTGMTLLHKAAEQGRTEIVFFLLKQGFIFDYTGPCKKTALELATEKQKNEVVKLLTAWTKDPESPEIVKMTEKFKKLIGECKQEYLKLPPEFKEVRKKMAAYGSMGHHPILMHALHQDNLQLFIRAHGLGAPINTISLADKNLERDPNSLMAAADRGYYQLYGTDTGMGKSLLHIAAANGSTDIIRYLLSQGLDPNQKDDEGHTAVEIALRHGRIKEAFLLMSDESPLGAQKSLEDPENFEKAVSVLAEASRQQDPLHINFQDRLGAIYGLALFAMQTGLAEKMGGYFQYLPFAMVAYTTGNVIYSILKGPDAIAMSMEQKLNETNRPSLKVQQLGAFLSKGFILEHLIGVRYPFLSLGSSVLGTIEQARQIFPTYKKISQQFVKRPLQATLKGGVEAVKMMTSAIFLTMYGKEIYKNATNDFFAPAVDSGFDCKIKNAQDAEKYKQDPKFKDIQARCSGKFENPELEPLNANCLKDAKVLLDAKWLDNPGLSQKKIYSAFAETLHPDQNPGLGKAFAEYSLARKTVSKVPSSGYLSWMVDGLQGGFEKVLQMSNPKIIADKPTTPGHTSFFDTIRDIPPGLQEIGKSAAAVLAIPVLDQLPGAPTMWMAAHKGRVVYVSLSPFYNSFKQWYTGEKPQET